MLTTSPKLHPCKNPGCEDTTFVVRGRYAYLCAHHRAELAGSKSSKKKQKNVPKLRETAIRLIEVCERIDEDAAQFRSAKNNLLQDITHLNDLIEDLKRSVKEATGMNAN